MRCGDPGLPSEAASRDASEKVVENAGWAFLNVVQEAMKTTGSHGDVNQEMFDAQGLDSCVESVTGKPFNLEVASRRQDLAPYKNTD